MAKKYIFADSTYTLSNPPKGVTVLEFDTETNTLGIYNNKKAAATIPVQAEKDDNGTFEIPTIPSKLSELKNDTKFITIADVDGKYALKTDVQSFLSDITYNNEDKVLSFKFKLSDGTDSVQNISVKDLVDTYTAGDGITIENNTISFNGNIPDVSNFITISDVTTALSDYALKSQIPTIPQMPSVPSKLSELQNDTKFITKSDVTEMLPEQPDLSVYALKSQIPTIPQIPSIPSKLSELQNDTKFITIDSVKTELSDYALKIDIPEIPDVSNFATKQELPKVDKFITSDDITSTLSDYALKTDIPSVPEIPGKLSELQNDIKFITLNDVPSSITEDFVNNAIKTFAKDYTAFEVMPNKVNILAGTIDNITGLEYKQEIPACTEHKFTLRSANSINNNDVIIDWGDGTIEAIKDGKYEWKSNKQYDLSHDYSESMTADIQRFIIKIYGRDYYTFRHNSYKDNNLISRIFAEDLPIASHIGNLASAAIHSNRLLKVHFPHSTSPYSNVWNWSYTFSNCKNLQSITGFEDLILRGDAWYDGFMTECINLKNTDFVIPATVTSLKGVFDGDINLECDIAKLLPKNGFSSSNILIKNVFNKTKIYGSIPADKLWNDKKINWIFEGITNMPFKDCSNEILSQVPVSWGGIKAEEIFIPEQLKIDYTAYQIFANDTEIVSGAISEQLGGYVNVNIPANMTEQIVIRSTVDQTKLDVIIDWGDGNVSTAADMTVILEDAPGKEYDFKVSHTYASSGKYIVKIYGKQYYGISHKDCNTLMCRVFDYDLPVATNLQNMTYFCCDALRLLNVNIPQYSHYLTVQNWSSCFIRCYNLVTVKGFKRRNEYLISCNAAFSECKNLETSDFRLPIRGQMQQVYRNCQKLAMNVSSLQPTAAFTRGATMNLFYSFYNCKSLTGSLNAKLWWNDNTINWTSTTNAFKGCSSIENLADIPATDAAWNE